MSPKWVSRLAWGSAALISATVLFTLFTGRADQGLGGDLLQLSANIVWTLFPLVFSLLAALILSHHPRNVIGWLMMIPAVILALSGLVDLYLNTFPTAPPNAFWTIWLLVSFSNWGWVLLIIPLLLIPLYFPTGSPPSPGWRWVFRAAIIMGSFFIFLGTFARKLGPLEGPDWQIVNPIGFLSDELINAIVFPWWLLALAALTLASVASLFVRYQQAGAVEREQIKWLLYTCGLFAVIYIPALFYNSREEEGAGFYLGELLFSLALLAIPVSIAIAITRYRLWDIDVIIRRTLIYGALTAALALVYAGSVVVLQQVFQRLSGNSEPSQAAIVLSTLAVAALFSPLRRRFQERIDRRFFRSRYDAERVLAAFSASLQHEFDVDQLRARLLEVVQETMQPENISIWLQGTGKERRK